MAQENKKNLDWSENLAKLIINGSKTTFHAVKEIYSGFKTRTIPVDILSIWTALFTAIVITHIDYRLFERAHLTIIYPFKPALYWSYVTFWGFLFPYFVWGLIHVVRLRILLKALTELFQCAGLKTSTGRLPGFVSDSPIDHGLREMKLYMNGIPKISFEKVQDQIGTSLHGFVDEIRENRTKGEISIRYSRWNFPEHTTIKNPAGVFPNTFVVGDTRTDRLEVSLVDCPHLLIGGQTNSGKSTFLKQMLLVLYLNNPTMRFTFLDFKGGVEAELFKDAERVEVKTKIDELLECFEKTVKMIDQRLEILRLNRCKNLGDLMKRDSSSLKWTTEISHINDFYRQILILDEAAVVFTANSMVDPKESVRAKNLASHIAAQGRAVGFHLIIGTQRPDVKAIDPLIKTHLMGRLCFRMSDNASSMTILDSVRAADLPGNPKGRAIWRCGPDLTEIQVPEIEDSRVEKYLKPFSSKESSTEVAQKNEAISPLSKTEMNGQEINEDEV